MNKHLYLYLFLLSSCLVAYGSLVSVDSLLTQEEKRVLKDELFLAAAQGNKERVVQILERGIEVFVCSEKGATVLHVAAKAGKIDLLKLFLGMPVSVDELDADGRAPLYYAIQSGDSEGVGLLLEHGADLQKTDNEGNTYLHHAVIGGNREICERLLAAGVPPSIKNFAGQIPFNAHGWFKDLFEKYENMRVGLFKAAYEGDVVKAKKLIASGAPFAIFINGGLLHLGEEATARMYFDVSFREAAFAGLSPLCIAALRGHREFVDLLFASAKGCWQKEKEDGAALCCAALNGHRDLVEDLLRRGVSPNSLCRFGMNALHAATLNGHSEIVKLLLDSGADPLIEASGLGFCLEGRIVISVDQSGGSTLPEDRFLVNSLYLAAIFGYTNILDLFQSRMAPQRFLEALQCIFNDVIKKSRCGPEKCAAVVKKMVEYGVNLAFSDADGNTLFHRLSSSFRVPEPVLKVLLEGGADVNAKNKLGHTPLQYLYSRERIPLPLQLKLLFQHAADFRVRNVYGRDESVADYLARSYFDRVCEALILCVREGCFAPLTALPLFFEKANPFQKSHLEWLLFEVVKTGNAKLLRSFLEVCNGNCFLPISHSKAPLKNFAGETINFEDPLFFAATHGYRDCVDVLLEKSVASVDTRDYYGNTALHLAAKAGHNGVVDILINKYRASLNVYNNVFVDKIPRPASGDQVRGQTPYDLNPQLMEPYVKAHQEKSIVQDEQKRSLGEGVLFQGKGEPFQNNIRYEGRMQRGLAVVPQEGEESLNRTRNATASLIAAVCGGDLKGVEKAISQGADINACDPLSKNYVIHIAIEKGNASIVRCLRMNGVDMSKKNVRGQTAEDMSKSACVVQ